MCMIDDAEPYRLLRQSDHHARREYRCDECSRTIAVGERYERAVGLNDGYWDTWRTCYHCLWAREWLMAECNGFCFGGVYEDLKEHWQGELMRDGHLGRAIVGMRLHWRMKSGGLYDLPARSPV